MAVIHEVTDAPVSISSGTQPFGPFNIQNSTERITLKLARCTTATPSLWADSNTAISVTLFVSVGQQEFNVGGFTAVGGILLSRSGAELTHTTAGFGMPPGTNRKGRFEVTVTNGPLSSLASVDVE